MPRRRRSVALADAACGVEYQDAVRRLAQALPLLAEIAKRVEAADADTRRASVVVSKNLTDAAKPFALTERDDR